MEERLTSSLYPSVVCKSGLFQSKGMRGVLKGLPPARYLTGQQPLFLPYPLRPMGSIY